MGCRVEKARQWKIRMVHEASLHHANCFITLTYDDEHLPEGGSLEKRAFPRFADAMRKRCSFRYYACGEYGDQSGRPHYHAAIFGQRWKPSDIEPSWGRGNVHVGEFTPESAGYVAGYVTKKVTGKKAKEAYGALEPPFAVMSRRPGIGRGWFDQFATEVFPSDEVIVQGRPQRPPRYYERLLAEREPEVRELVQEERARHAGDEWNNSCARLRVREKCAQSRLNSRKRRDAV